MNVSVCFCPNVLLLDIIETSEEGGLQCWLRWALPPFQLFITVMKFAFVYSLYLSLVSLATATLWLQGSVWVTIFVTPITCKKYVQISTCRIWICDHIYYMFHALINELITLLTKKKSDLISLIFSHQNYLLKLLFAPRFVIYFTNDFRDQSNCSLDVFQWKCRMENGKPSIFLCVNVLWLVFSLKRKNRRQF